MELLTLVHTVISLAAIAAGFGVVFGMIHGKSSPHWTGVFLATTIITSVSGYFFPAPNGVTPGHIVGALSLVALAVAVLALYRFNLRGAWATAYVVTCVAALYFNVFVGFAQAFQKIPEMKALAPTQAEPPFGLVQGGVLLLFLYLGRKALKGFQEHRFI